MDGKLAGDVVSLLNVFPVHEGSKLEKKRFVRCILIKTLFIMSAFAGDQDVTYEGDLQLLMWCAHILAWLGAHMMRCWLQLRIQTPQNLEYSFLFTHALCCSRADMYLIDRGEDKVRNICWLRWHFQKAWIWSSSTVTITETTRQRKRQRVVDIMGVVELLANLS